MKLYRKTGTIISIFSILIAVYSFSCSSSEEKESVQSSKAKETLDDYKDDTPTFVAEVKTEIKENYLFFSYKGPEFAVVNGQMNDTAHRLSNYAARITGDQLKKLFKEGKYSKVDLSRIVMKTKGMNNKDSVHYTLKIPLIRVKSDCAAFTSFDHSGGWNHSPDLKKRLEDLKKLGRTTVHCNYLRVSKLYITNENLQEYWIQWKNRQLQGNCPCK
ncbi:MAG: hypothetical protein ACKO00_00810 [Crocinitomicaceae bacterium]